MTAAQMNALRDDLNFLKGALDIITNSTDSDSGVTSYLQITRASAVQAFNTLISGDTNPRLQILADGSLNWGTGSTTSDVTLSRPQTNVLETGGYHRIRVPVGTTRGLVGLVTGDANDRFELLVDTTGLPKLTFGGGSGGVDTQLHRASAGALEVAATPATSLFLTGAAAGAEKLRVKITGDAGYRMIMGADGKMTWSDGSGSADTVLNRPQVGVLALNNLLWGQHGVATWSNAGAPSDAIFNAAQAGLVPMSGTLYLDTTNSKLWCRVNATWKGVVLV